MRIFMTLNQNCSLTPESVIPAQAGIQAIGKSPGSVSKSRFGLSSQLAASTSSFCTLRGLFAWLDSSLRGNDWVKGLFGLNMLLAAGLMLAALPTPAANEPAGAASSRIAKAQEPSKEDAIIGKLEFKDAAMIDVIRALADMSGLNIVATEEAAKKRVTVFLQDISVKDALDTISKNSGLWYRQEKSGKTFRIMTTKEYQQDMVVYREDTTRIFKLLHPNPTEVATAIRDIYGQRVMLPQLCDAGEVRRLGGSTTGVSGGSSSSSRTSNSGRQSTGTGNTRATNNRTTNTGRGNTGGVTVAGGYLGQSDRLVNEQLTADQLAKLESAIGGTDNGTVASDELGRITGSDPLIYLTVNCEHNLIVMRTGDMAAIKDIEHLVKQMDRPVPQVLLEMKILELSTGDSFEQLFDVNYQAGGLKTGPGVWFSGPARPTPATTVPGTPIVTTVNGVTTVTPTTVTIPATTGDPAYQSDLFRQHNLTAGAGSLVYQFLSNHVSAKIKLLESQNRVKTLSSPMLLASNNRKSELFMGTESLITKGWNPGSTVVNNGQTTVVAPYPALEVTDVGPKLTITPKINADGTVTLEIDEQVTSISRNLSQVYIADASGQVVPRFVDGLSKATINGIVTAKDGLTVAIGGLIRTSESKQDSKVPILGDIPLVGELFKSKNDKNDKIEMILLITPHLITNPEEVENVTRDVVEPVSSQEW